MKSKQHSQKTRVFISYCWADSEYVNRMEKSFSVIERKSIIRDIRDAKDYTSIKSFMKKIKSSDYVILVISHSYMTSRNCMYEILELLKNDNYKSQILPVIIKDKELDIYSDKAIPKYINFWRNKYEHLHNEYKDFSPEEKVEIGENLRIISNIRTSIGSFISALQDLKSPSLSDLEATNYLQIKSKIWRYPRKFDPDLLNKCLVRMWEKDVAIALKRHSTDDQVTFGDWLLNCIATSETTPIMKSEAYKSFELCLDIITEMGQQTATSKKTCRKIFNSYIDLINNFIRDKCGIVQYGFDVLKEENLENIINNTIKLMNRANSTGCFESPLFNPSLFLISVKCLAFAEDMKIATEVYKENDRVKVGDCLLERTQKRPFICQNSLILDALIIREMGQLTKNAIEKRNSIIGSIQDSFSYDWEYNDWIQHRKKVLINALFIIGDDDSMNALHSRFGNGLNYEVKVAKVNAKLKNEIKKVEDFLSF